MSTLAAGEAHRVRSRLPPPDGRTAGIVAAAALAAVALGFAWNAGVKSASAVPDVARVLAAAGLLFTAAGYAPTRLLLPRGMLPHLAVAVPLVGAAVSSLALTVLGFLHIPIEAVARGGRGRGNGGGGGAAAAPRPGARPGRGPGASGRRGPAAALAGVHRGPDRLDHADPHLARGLREHHRAERRRRAGRGHGGVPQQDAAPRRGHRPVRGPDAEELALEVPDLLRARGRVRAVRPRDHPGVRHDDVADARDWRRRASSCSPTTRSRRERSARSW